MNDPPRIEQLHAHAIILYTSAISLSRRMVDLVAAAAGVLLQSVRVLRSSFLVSPALDLRNSPCASCNCLLATLALPNSDRVSLDSVLAAERADVSGVLADFHLLDLLSEGGTITGTVFTGHTDLCSIVSIVERSQLRTWRFY